MELNHLKESLPSLNKAWRNDIEAAYNDLINVESELRVLKNAIYMREFDKFKSTIDLSAVSRAYAFHRMTFNGGQWKSFIEDLFNQPTVEDIKSFNDEIESAIQ